MRKIVVLVILIVLGMVLTAAAGEGGYYIGAGVGSFGLDDAKYAPPGDAKYNLKEGDLLYMSIGREFAHLRLEVEWSKRENTITDLGGFTAEGTYTAETLMLNAYYDFKNSTFMTPFLGIGLGMAGISVDNTNVEFPLPIGTQMMAEGDSSVTAYQGAAGIAFELGESFRIDLAYVFFTTSDPSFEVPGTGETVKSSYAGDDVRVGLRYVF